MADATKPITKVWIIDGCIVCDACATECPEVFSVQDSTCVVRPEAASIQFLLPLADKIIKAANACPTSVIKYETGAAVAAAPKPDAAMPATGQPAEKPAVNPAAAIEPAAAKPASASAPKPDAAMPAAGQPAEKPAVNPAAVKPAETKPAAAKPVAEKPASKPAKPAPPPKPKFLRKDPGDLPDPLLQAVTDKSQLPASRAAASSESRRAAAAMAAVELPAGAPPDMRASILASAGAYAPKATLEQHIKASKGRMLWHKLTGRKVSVEPRRIRNGDHMPWFTRRNINLSLAVGWGALAFCGVAALAVVQDFLAPKVGREPRKIWRVGRFEEFTAPGLVYERFKRTPAGEPGFWIVNLAGQPRIVAISTVCTHLGCIPDWLKGDAKFKCPCHGSGFHLTGVNFEGPAPRPLERFGISRDADGQVVVDMARVYRQELGQWDNPGSYLAAG